LLEEIDKIMKSGGFHVSMKVKDKGREFSGGIDKGRC